MMLRPLDHGGRGRARQERNRRFRLFQSAEFEKLLIEARQQVIQERAKRQKRHEARPDVSRLTRDPEELEYWKISRSLSLIKDGQLSKAARTLTQSHLAPMTEENLHKAQRKHPRRAVPCCSSQGFNGAGEETKGEEGLAEDAPQPASPTIDPATLVAAVRTASRGSSPGITGWRYEHLKALLEPDGGDEAPLIQPFMQALVNSAAVPGETRQLLRVGTGFLLNKEDGDVRPITTADTLRRTATRTLVFQFKERWRDHLGPMQFAVGTPNCALLLDAENAFNCCDRQVFMDALQKDFP